MHTQQQTFLVEVSFADSTLKFKGLELNIRVFLTFYSDIYDQFNNDVFLFSSSIVQEFKPPWFVLCSLNCNPSNISFIQNIVKIPGKISKYDTEFHVKENLFLPLYFVFSHFLQLTQLLRINVDTKCIANAQQRPQLEVKEDQAIGETVLKSSNLKIIPKEAQIAQYRKDIRIRSNAAKVTNQSYKGLTIEKNKSFACA